jgi:hypothetical protein
VPARLERAGAAALLRTSRLAYKLPFALEAGVRPVTWNGDFTLTGGKELQWQWAAAAYKTFTTEYNELEIKPLHSTTPDKYHNGDQAGTPEDKTFQKEVEGGARGGGDSTSLAPPTRPANPSSRVTRKPRPTKDRSGLRGMENRRTPPSEHDGSRRVRRCRTRTSS